jgi:PspA/IM30 family
MRLLFLVAVASIQAAVAFVGPTVVSNTNRLATATSTSSVSRMTPVLHMNLFDRFSRVAKASLNDLLNKVEDPEKIMTQALEDMQVRGIGEHFMVLFSIDHCFLPLVVRIFFP